MRLIQRHIDLLLQSKHVWFQSVLLNNLIFVKGIKKFTTTSFIYCKEINQKNDSDLPKTKTQAAVPQKKPFNPPYVPEEDKKIVERLKTGDRLYPYNTETEKFTAVMKDDIKREISKQVYSLTNIELDPMKKTYFPRECDILVIGSGLVGLAAAYFVTMEFPGTCKVIVVDKISNSPESTLNLCAGTLTLQNFRSMEEMLMIRFGAEFLSSFARHTSMPGHKEMRIPYDPIGSLVLADQTNAETVLRNHQTLKDLNIPTKLIKKETLSQNYPWLNTDDLEFGCLATYHEGLVDPWAIAHGLKCKIINMDGQFATAEVVDFGIHNDRCKYAVCRLPDKTYDFISFGACVIAAGMGSGSLLDALNVYEDTIFKVRIPEEERICYEYCFRDPRGPGFNTPIVFNPNGVYYRREGLGELYVAGVGNLTGDQGNDESKAHEVFEDRIKPFLTSRLYGLKEVELRGGWIETCTSNKANDFGVLGCHPSYSEVTLGIGFSHKGWAHALGAGKAIAESVFYGKYKTIDMSKFNVENLWWRQWKEYEIAKRKSLEKKIAKKLAQSQGVTRKEEHQGLH